MNGSTPVAIAACDLREATSMFAECRPRLTSIAYRLLGDIDEAEDIVQETWIRWQTCDRSTVRNASAFLATTTTRLALNVAQSARARRETYMGAWVAEPVDIAADPVAGVERTEAIEFAVQLILETLSPAERAAYVLREAFDYPYDQIAEVIHQTQANVRQLVSRARKHLDGERRSPAVTDDQRRLLAAFVAGAQTGNLTPLEQLLATDAIATKARV